MIAVAKKGEHEFVHGENIMSFSPPFHFVVTVSVSVPVKFIQKLGRNEKTRSSIFIDQAKVIITILQKRHVKIYDLKRLSKMHYENTNITMHLIFALTSPFTHIPGFSV